MRRFSELIYEEAALARNNIWSRAFLWWIFFAAPTALVLKSYWTMHVMAYVWLEEVHSCHIYWVDQNCEVWKFTSSALSVDRLFSPKPGSEEREHSPEAWDMWLVSGVWAVPSLFLYRLGCIPSFLLEPGSRRRADSNLSEGRIVVFQNFFGRKVRNHLARALGWTSDIHIDNDKYYI